MIGTERSSVAYVMIFVCQRNCFAFMLNAEIYQHFAMRCHVQLMRAPPDAVKIHDMIQQQVSMCRCRQKYQIHQVGDGKYRVSSSVTCENVPLVKMKF